MGRESTARRRPPLLEIQIVENPRGRPNMPGKAELMQRIRELEEENDQLHDQLDQVAGIVAPPEQEDDYDQDDESGEG